MVNADFTINGLDEPTLVLKIQGTSHFLHNMNAGWYFIDEIELSAGEANVTFAPTNNLPEQLRNYGKCKITFMPHENLELIVKETDSAKHCSAIKFVFLNCKLNKQGKPYFHYDILQKAFAKESFNSPIPRNVTIEGLLEEGYTREISGDDEDACFYSTILDHRMAS